MNQWQLICNHVNNFKMNCRWFFQGQYDHLFTNKKKESANKSSIQTDHLSIIDVLKKTKLDQNIQNAQSVMKIVSPPSLHVKKSAASPSFFLYICHTGVFEVTKLISDKYNLHIKLCFHLKKTKQNKKQKLTLHVKQFPAQFLH